MAYIIDGHNLIGVLPDINLADPGDEERLLGRLRAYRARTGAGPMIVFFDSGPLGSASGGDTRGSGLAVEAHFTESGQTADDAIVAFLRTVAQPGQYAVVTDDLELTWRVQELGASTLRAREFARRLAPRNGRGANRSTAGGTGEETLDPRAPAFADLYDGFIAADKGRERFPEGTIAGVEHWTEKLYSDDIDEAQRAAGWLGLHGGEEGLEPLKDALTHSDVRVRAAALLALGNLGDRRALPLLCDRLARDAAGMAREAAAQSLGRIGDQSVAKALEASAEGDTKGKVRRAARDALAQIRARTAKPPP